jgi:regulator of sigma E protease
MSFTPLNVVFAILGISLLVIVHEAGHYLAARAFGMRVLRFSIGLGPPLWRHKPKDSPTTFQVCAIPLLAYVQIDGMNPTEKIDPDDPELYPNKGVFARIVTIFAGPFANYLAASVLIFAVATVGGLPDMHLTNRVADTMKGMPAQLAKLRRGDVVVEVNGQPIANGEELVEANRGRGGEETTYVIERDGERMEVVLQPEMRDAGNGEERPLIGIELEAERRWRTLAVDEAAEKAVTLPVVLSAANLEAIARLIRQRNTDDVASVVKMGKILADSIEIAPQAYLWILIQLSIALGLFNLLPFPALDGGRLTFLGYEVITRRRANEKVEAAIHTVGLLFLLGVIALVMVRDVIELT